jgi:hypothetical protein
LLDLWKSQLIDNIIALKSAFFKTARGVIKGGGAHYLPSSESS